MPPKLSLKPLLKTFLFLPLLLIIIINILIIVFAPPTHAQQSLSLSLWPPILEIMIQPGRQATQEYQITNNSDTDLKITPYFIPFKPSNQTGQPNLKLQDLQNKNFNPGFFAFETGEKIGEPFWLKTGQTKKLLLKILIPKEAEEKDYYYTLLFSTSPATKEQKNTSSSSTTEIGTNILLTISQSGTPKLFGKISSFSCPKIVDSFSPVNFNLVLENYGQTYFKAFGKLKIAGFLKQSQEIALTPQNVLANSTRQIPLPPYQPKLPLGPFTAQVEISLNEESPPQFSRQISFWYLPYKILLPATFFVIIYLFFRKLSKKPKIDPNTPLDKTL